MYFKKIQTKLFKLLYQMGLKFLAKNKYKNKLKFEPSFGNLGLRRMAI